MSIKRNKKICKGCGQSKYIFGHGLCGYCYGINLREKQMEKQQTERSKRPRVKRPAINRVSMRQATVMEKDRQVWKEIWEEREHFCEECLMIYGKGDKSYLGTKRRAYMFSHLLTKNAHPKLRHVKLNFSLSCYTHHQQYEFGKRLEMKMWPEFEKRIAKLYIIENGN